MKSGIYPFLKLKRKDQLSFENWFDQGLYLPDRKFPPKILVKGESGLCGGYFSVYDQRISPQEVFNACKTRRWSFFDELIGEFFIIFADFDFEEIFVIVDQNGKFPCYFSMIDDQLTLSVDFSLVKDSVKNKSLNLDYAFDFLNSSNFLLQTDETILNEIGQIPTGTILRINHNLEIGLKSFVDIDKFFGNKPPVFKSLGEFSNAFLSKLEEIIREKTTILNKLDLNFTSDLSSGFDSSLISYLLKKTTAKPFSCVSWKSQYIVGDTDPRIVQEFANKHNLKVDFFNVDDLFPFSSFDLDWVGKNFYPASHATELSFNLCKNLLNNRINVLFQGVGGDEIYASSNLELETRFLPQTIFFKAFVGHLRDNKLELVFTPKGLEYFLNHERFRQKNYFPIIHSPSALYLETQYFSVLWENDVWPISPFIDQRLSQLCRGIPRRDSKLPTKFGIWKDHDEIFTKSQFRPNSHMSNLFNRCLKERKDVVLTILGNSKLEETGMLYISELRYNFENGNEDMYLADNGVSAIIQNLVHLEYFLQNNNVRIPDNW